MSQPRYAAAGIFSSFKGISIRGALFGTLVLALAVLLGLPSVRHSGRAVAATSGPQAAVAAPAPGQDRIDSLLQDAAIRPSTVATAVPVAARPSPSRAAGTGLLGPAGVTGELGIPTMVLQAYRQAAAELATEQASCHLPWWLLAGIGHTESGHAESGRLYADGTTRGRILGPVLNGGIAGDAVITDTDHGAYDGDTTYDRAVGPMQFIPSTWRTWGADGNHDGKKDPNNIFDATLAAGRYLCADGRNLATKAGLQAAVLSYNHSQAYLDTVLAWGYAYRSGASSLPDQSIPVVGDVTKVRPPLGSKPPHKPVRVTSTPTGSPSRSGSASPTGSARPTGSASPTGSSSGSGSASSTPTCTSSPSTSPTGSASSTGTGSSAASSSAATAASSAGEQAATSAAEASADGNSTGSSSTSASTSPTGSCHR